MSYPKTLFVLTCAVLLSGCAHAPDILPTTNWQLNETTALSQLQKDLKEALKKDWEVREQNSQITATGPGSCPGQINESIISSCSLDSEPKFEIYKLKEQNFDYVSNATMALYCPSENRYWITQVVWGCFGPSCSTGGPFTLGDKEK